MILCKVYIFLTSITIFPQHGCSIIKSLLVKYILITGHLFKMNLYFNQKKQSVSVSICQTTTSRLGIIFHPPCLDFGQASPESKPSPGFPKKWKYYSAFVTLTFTRYTRLRSTMSTVLSFSFHNKLLTNVFNSK